jgi:hypothetical protein
VEILVGTPWEMIDQMPDITKLYVMEVIKTMLQIGVVIELFILAEVRTTLTIIAFIHIAITIIVFEGARTIITITIINITIE